MSIKDISRKIKSFTLSLEKAPFFGITLIVLVVSLFFGVSRLATNTINAVPVEITTNRSMEALKEEQSGVEKARLFGSKNGKKYYPVGCKSGNRISDANKIWFSTEKEAAMLGYSLASGCKI